MQAPLLTGEDAAAYVNVGGYIEGGHSRNDEIAGLHRGGANLYATDGSAYWMKKPYGKSASDWQAYAPSGSAVSIGLSGATWASWNNR